MLGKIPIKEALSGNERNEWLRVMSEELKAMLKNGIWELVNLKTMKSSDSYRADGNFEKKKA